MYGKCDSTDSNSDDEDYVPYVPLKIRRKEQLIKLGQLEPSVKTCVEEYAVENDNQNDNLDENVVSGRKYNISLLDQHTELKKIAEGSYF